MVVLISKERPGALLGQMDNPGTFSSFLRGLNKLNYHGESSGLEWGIAECNIAYRVLDKSSFV